MVPSRCPDKGSTLNRMPRESKVVYEAEADVPLGHRFGGILEIAEYVSELMDTIWWQNAWPDVRCVYVRESKAKTYAYTRGSTMFLPEWAWNEAYVLHELAHVIEPQTEHGVPFRQTYIMLVEKRMGRDAARALRRSYREHGLRYTNISG